MPGILPLSGSYSGKSCTTMTPWKQEARSKKPGKSVANDNNSFLFIEFIPMPQHCFPKHQEVISAFYATSLSSDKALYGNALSPSFERAPTGHNFSDPF